MANLSNAHLFEVHSFKRPSICQLCEHLITGVYKQGLRCKRCGINIHYHCEKELLDSCVELISGQHNFVNHHFYVPTQCDLCEHHITLFVSGLKCSECSYIVHTKCHEAVSVTCNVKPRIISPAKKHLKINDHLTKSYNQNSYNSMNDVVTSVPKTEISQHQSQVKDVQNATRSCVEELLKRNDNINNMEESSSRFLKLAKEFRKFLIESNASSSHRKKIYVIVIIFTLILLFSFGLTLIFVNSKK